MNAMTQTEVAPISISSSAVLCDITIRCWTGRKLDKKVSDEVNTNKQAAKNVARVNKNLFADDPRLAAINSYAAGLRNLINASTIRWTDGGTRLVTTAQLVNGFESVLQQKQAEFNDLVEDFVQMYPTLISAQAFKLGTMFDRNEYPSPQDIRRKFSLEYTFSPVPESGDFRVDIGNEANRVLQEQYQQAYERRVNEAMGDVWSRLREVVEHMVDRLGTDEIGKNKVFRDTLITNAIEVCDMLRDVNITNDPKLEQARRLTEQALLGITADDLRKDKSTREDVRNQMKDVLDKFAF